ncbi:hypothetical protein [Candidatus Tisiphia endosymbiont of Mystacides longicornis]|uniref:hypothetical protein n=2 Tax=unclassified Candidatus Tisiphia TaxID=2996318 RepID=UPI003CCB3FA3
MIKATPWYLQYKKVYKLNYLLIIICLILCQVTSILANNYSHDYKTLVHNEDFNFVWGKDLNKYRPFTANIELAQFNGEDFGPQGEIADRYNWAREVISYDELKVRLLNSAKLINSGQQVKLINRVQSTLIEDILGFKKSYNVQTSLEFLRNIKIKNLEQKLLSRVLALSSYDALDKVSLKKQDVVKVIYNDLYFIEKDLLPQAKKSSAANFISFCLYQDSQRRIRIHKIMPSIQKHDEFPHNHYGSSASSLLAGSLVNQHIAVIPAKYALDANFGLYLLTRTSFTGPREEQTKVSFFQTNVKVGIMSSHLYKYGDHYFLPGSRDIKNDLTINDTLTFHRVGTENYAITLFSQQMSGRTSTHTTYNIGNPSIIYKKYDALLSQRESVELMNKMDKIIKTCNK